MNFLLKLFYCLLTFFFMVMAVEATQSEALNRIEAHKIYRSSLQDPQGKIFTPEEKQALGPMELLWQDITPDPEGVFQLQFNPELYQGETNLLLFLKHQDEPVAIVTYTPSVFRFLGLEGSSFDLRGLPYQPTSPPLTSPLSDWINQSSAEDRAAFWPHCYIHVQDNLTLRDGTFQGKAQVHAQNIFLKGQTFATDLLTLQASHKCQLEDRLWVSKLKVGCADLSQQSDVWCQQALFESQTGHCAPNSFVRADQDILLRGFEHFTQQGDFRAKRFVLIDGDHLHRSPEAYTFAGTLYSAKASTCQDQGQTTAWQHQLTAFNILFDETYRFLGHYLWAYAGSEELEASSLSGAFLKTAKGSQITLGFANHLQSQNRLIHQGDISLSASLAYHFPFWQYWGGPHSPSLFGTTPASQSAFRRLSYEMSLPRHEIKALLQNKSGVLLEAKGTLEHEGTIKTTFTSIQEQAGRILFSGHNHSGFLETNKTWMKANQGIFQGILKAPSGIHFDIDQHLDLGGHLRASLLQAIAPHINLSGQTQTRVLELETPVLEIAPHSAHSAQESLSLRVQDCLNNQGRLLSQGDLSLTGVRDYHLGDLHATHCFNFAPQELPHIYTLYHHPDPALTQNGGLNLVSSRHEVLDQPLDLPFGLGLKALSIHVKSPLITPADIYLESTQGPVQIEASLKARTLDVISAGEIQNSSPIHLTQNGRFKAKGPFLNHQQILAPQGQIDIEGSCIKNIGTYSKIIAQIVTMKASESNIENEGRLQGDLYLEGIAAGDIVCKGFAHEDEKEPYFIPACIEGGQGLPYRDFKGQTRSLSLNLQAGDKIDNYVSYLNALHDIFMMAKQGICHQGDSMEYIAYEKKHSSFLSFRKKKVIVRKELVGQPVIHSDQGRVISCVPEGGIEYKGAQERGVQGDYVLVRDQIQYHAFIIETSKEQKKSSWWGASKSSDQEIHQDAVITEIANDDVIEHVSLNEGIYGQAPSIDAPIYRLRSQKPAIFEGVKLHHHHEIKKRGFHLSFFGSEGIKGRSLVNEDPLLQKVSDLRQARHPAGRFASGVKLGVQAWNDFKNLAEYSQLGQPEMFFLERYGNVSLDYHRSHDTHDETTTASPFFNLEEADFGDVDEVQLLDGTRLQVRDRVILPPHLTLGKATDESHQHSKSSSTRLGVNVFTGMPSFSHDQGRSRGDTQTHRPGLIHIYGDQGVLDATNAQSLNLDGGTLIAPRAQGTIDEVKITSYQDQSRSSQSSFGLGGGGTMATGLRGSVYASGGRAQETKTSQPSHLQIHDPSELTIGHLQVTGPSLDSPIADRAQQTTFTRLQDKLSSHHYQMALSNLKLGSLKEFIQSFNQGLGQAVRGVVVSELARKAGANDLGASVLGTMGALSRSADGTSQDLNLGGEISYERDGRQTHIPLVNINPRPVPSATHDNSHSSLEEKGQEGETSNKEDLLHILQQEGATPEEAQTILTDPDLSRLHELGQSFNHDWNHKIIVKSLMPEEFSSSSSSPQPWTFWKQALSLSEEGAITLDRFAQQHPNLTKYAIISMQLGLGGPTRYVAHEMANYAAGDQLQELKQKGVAYFSRQFDIPDHDVEVTASVLNFALSLTFDKAKGVIKEAHHVSKAVEKRSITLNIKSLDSQGTKELKKDTKLSKDQPWTIRPGQEWKEKIIGKAQKTGTDGHATASYRTAIKEAKKEEIDKVYLNRGIKKATGEDIGPNTRPDVTSVTKDGKVNQFEVPSKTDKRDSLLERMKIAREKFSPAKRGENELVEITKSKSSE